MSGVRSNILIDGARPPPKGKSAREQLDEMPVAGVALIELIDAGTRLDIDMQGYPQVINVITVENRPAYYEVTTEMQRSGTGENDQENERVAELDGTGTFFLGAHELTLTGEAYFDVAHDEKKPFILHTRKMDVKVLGTVFNVKAYPGDDLTEAALIRGSIEVTFPGRPQEKLILKPNDKISIVSKETNKKVDTARRTQDGNKERPAIMVSSIQYEPADSAVIETAWVNNKLIFRTL